MACPHGIAGVVLQLAGKGSALDICTGIENYDLTVLNDSSDPMRLSAQGTYVEDPVMQSKGCGHTFGRVTQLKHLVVPST